MNVSGLTLNFQQLAFLQVNSHHVTYESEDEGIQIMQEGIQMAVKHFSSSMKVNSACRKL